MFSVRIILVLQLRRDSKGLIYKLYESDILIAERYSPKSALRLFPPKWPSTEPDKLFQWVPDLTGAAIPSLEEIPAFRMIDRDPIYGSLLRYMTYLIGAHVEPGDQIWRFSHSDFRHRCTDRRLSCDLARRWSQLNNRTSLGLYEA